MDSPNISVAFIVLFMVIFHTYGGYYAYEHKFSKGVFDRSKLILVLSNIFNGLDISMSLFLGVCILDGKSCAVKTEVWLIVISVYLSNCFYMTNLLRVYRVYILSKLQRGEFKLQSLGWKKSQLSNTFYLILTCGGSIIWSLPYCSLIIGKYEKNPAIISNSDTYAMYIGITIGIQCCVYLVFLLIIMFKNVHITMKIEFIFQLICWGAALLVLKNPVNQRIFFLIPIRNFIMMMLTIVSTYEHNSMIKPPLPPDIDLQFILSTQEFFKAFKMYLDNLNDHKSKELLDVLLKIKIYLSSKSKTMIKVVKECILNCQSIPQNVKKAFYKDFKSNKHNEANLENLFEEIENHCYNYLSEGPVLEFLSSNEFLDAKVNY
ncbi:hypothetical protein SteCoe_16956 [Stentor coeruleus]|uniref:RGS domain-containing protein n=1 Tax=Stentor coeruleus TaxID=5963 RepID=A0A1R2C032_9CILI|nr:hypothetical protein SteCoe_16956 [Stentor coeruleus]